jgi:hypothetical protein
LPKAVPLEKLPVETQIRRIFGKDAKMALAISWAENGTRACNRTHINKDKSIDVGVFQLNSVHSPKGNLYDCLENIRIAKAIFKRQGWSPWIVYQTKAYIKYKKFNE